NQARDVFVHDRLTATTERISVAADGSEGDDDSMWPAISPDGGIVVFTSDASNLVLADMNQTTDVFVAQYLVSPPPTSSTSSTIPTTTTVPQGSGDYFVDDDGHTFEADIDWL